MREYGFELRLAAHLERAVATTTGGERGQGRVSTEAGSDPAVADLEPGGILARQLGTSVAGVGARVMDLVYVEPGTEFDARRRLSAATIPPLAIESEVGIGRFTPVSRAIDAPPEIATRVAETAAEAGFFELGRRSGTAVVRQTTRYPAWYGRLIGIENKPDLASPGDLAAQLRQDVSLGVLDAVILATESYVTRAHLNRLPDAVGVWQVDLSAASPIEVVRPPEPLGAGEPGFEILAEQPGQFQVEPVSPGAKARQRRRIAERAYGKGWRTFELPACANASPTDVAETDGLPGCDWKGRLVDPAAECGPGCGGHQPATPPAVDLAAERARRTPWIEDPPGVARRQADLAHFRED